MRLSRQDWVPTLFFRKGCDQRRTAEQQDSHCYCQFSQLRDVGITRYDVVHWQQRHIAAEWAATIWTFVRFDSPTPSATALSRFENLCPGLSQCRSLGLVEFGDNHPASFGLPGCVGSGCFWWLGAGLMSTLAFGPTRARV